MVIAHAIVEKRGIPVDGVEIELFLAETQAVAVGINDVVEYDLFAYRKDATTLDAHKTTAFVEDDGVVIPQRLVWRGASHKWRLAFVVYDDIVVKTACFHIPGKINRLTMVTVDVVVIDIRSGSTAADMHIESSAVSTIIGNKFTVMYVEGSVAAENHAATPAAIIMCKIAIFDDTNSGIHHINTTATISWHLSRTCIIGMVVGKRAMAHATILFVVKV